MNTYSEILKSEAISDEVIRNLKLEELDTEGYQKIVKISSVKDTEVITIAGNVKRPKRSCSDYERDCFCVSTENCQDYEYRKRNGIEFCESPRTEIESLQC